MHIFSRHFTAQYTRLQFRSHTTASRTYQGIQNRPVHLTRGRAQIRFRGHSTGWFHILFAEYFSNADVHEALSSAQGVQPFPFTCVTRIETCRRCLCWPFTNRKKIENKIERLQRPSPKRTLRQTRSDALVTRSLALKWNAKPSSVA